MRAISIQQPYVELILRGVKRREYRSRPTTIRERVYLYASLKSRASAADWRKAGVPKDTLPRGRIVGTVEIVGCVQRPSGNFAYLLSKPSRLKRTRRPTNQPQPSFWRPQF